MWLQLLFVPGEAVPEECAAAEEADEEQGETLLIN